MKLNQNLAYQLTERGILPDAMLRQGIRLLLKGRLQEINALDCETMAQQEQSFIRMMNAAPVALQADKANEQHYEVPADFFRTVLGDRLKYSCGLWNDNCQTLDQSEINALRQTAQHAELKNGQSILELGCGWGSLTLWMAEQYPQSRITAVSNSLSQGDFIQQLAHESNLSNIEVVTADMNDFNTTEQYDRIVSVEMFEHMRNYSELYQRISNWLKPGGKFFKHIFVNRATPYLFEDKQSNDWMSRHFFSGGMMPSDSLSLNFQDHLKIENHWRWDGRHYEKTSNAWLQKMDSNKAKLWPLFEETYGQDFAAVWWQRWRLFFMACAELFGYDKGQQWWVSHYLFGKR
ncbi:MAG: class I SAM-dependent methyltransferase [Gammaproteobacteria bacterium]|nr:class I SAM-dependent methyltransferase [Gammaproteobacteria bacterium]